MRTSAVLRLTVALALAVAVPACGDITGTSSSGPGETASTSASTAASASGSTNSGTGSTNSATSPTSPQPAPDPSAAQNGPVEFSADTYSVAQNAGSVTLTVNRTGSAISAASISYATADGTAVAGTDYQAVGGTLEWAENDSTPRTISVPINDATGFSGNRTFAVALVSPSAKVTVGSPATAQVSIAGSATASAGSVKLSSASYSLSATSRNVTVNVIRSGGTKGAVSVGYETVDGTAVAGTHYTATHGVLEWADGDASVRQISIAVGGSAFAGTRQFSVVLSNPRSGVELGSPSRATVTLSGAASALAGTFQLSSPSYAVKQGTAKLVVPVRRMIGSHGAASVFIRTAHQTASAGVDYSPQQTELKWADGDSSTKSFVISFLKTSPFTGTRTLQVVLLTPSAGAKIGSPGTASVTIHGSGAAPVGTVELSAASYSIGQAKGPLRVSVRRVGGSSGRISVGYAETGKTAVAGKDFTAASGTLRWADGDSSPKVLTIDISNAKPFSGTKSFMISLSSPSGGTALVNPSTAIATITGDAPAAAGSVQLSASTYSVAQSAGDAALSVHRTGGSAGAISVAFATASAGAVAGTDFTSTRGTLHWADGDATSKTISIPISNAKPFTGTKSFSLSLSAPAGGATLGAPEAATVTISGTGVPGTAPVGKLQLSTSAYSIKQTDGTLFVKVTRTGGSAGTTSVKYATSNGTATAGSDYTAAAGTLTWNDGDTSTRQVPIQVSSAALFSGSKEFTIALSGPTSGASLGTPSTATITIDGGAQPAVGSLELSASTYTVAQNSGTLTVTVNRTGGFSGAVNVKYSTSDGTAVAGTDYTAENGTLNWADGDATAKTFSIPVSNLAPFSGTKSLSVSLSGAGGGATLGSPSNASVTITGSSSGGTGNVFWVYHNGQFNWQGDYSWNASINYKDTAGGPISGPYDIAVSITAPWGGFQPYALNGQFDTTPYKYLTFSFKPTVPNQIIGMGIDAMNDVPDGNVINVVGVPGSPSTKYGPLPVVGQWTTYKIPLADFNLNNPVILKFAIADGTGNSTNRYYVDDIAFTTQ